MRITRWTLGILIACSLIPFANADDGKSPPPLELRLIARRTTYPFEKGPMPHCFVAIDVELKNVSKQALHLHLAPEPELILTGPRQESARKSGGGFFFVPQEINVMLAANATRRVQLRTLTYRIGAARYQVEWTEPGDYALHASYRITASPRPAGSVPGRIEPRSGKIVADAKSGVVVIKSAPLKLQIRAGSVVEYWADLFSDKDAELRRIALLNLRDMGPAAFPAAKRVAGLLTDADASVRASAIHALEAIGPKAPAAARDGLLQALHDRDKRVKLSAIKAVAHVAPAEKAVGAALLELLRDADKDVRFAAAQAWHDMPYKGRRVTPSDTDALLAAFKAEQNVDVQRRLIAALLHHPRLDVLNELYPVLRSTDKSTRFEVLHTLGRMGTFVERDRKRNVQLGNPIGKTVQALIEAMKDHEMMPQAVYALARFGPDAAPAVPALLHALDDVRNQNKDSIHHPRVGIVQALRDIGPGAKSAAKPLALRMLTDPDWSVRAHAVQALTTIGADPRIVGPALNQAFKDQMIQVRQQVAPALAKLGAVEALLDGLHDENPETRRGIIIALGTMKDHVKQAVPALVKAMREDKDALNRRNAAYALGALKAVVAVPDLAKALKDGDSDVRLGVVDALRSIGPDARAGIAPLIAVVKTDQSRQVREKACWALYAINVKGHKELAPTLVEMLTERDAEFVMPAIYLAMQLGPDASATRDHLRRIGQRKDAHGNAARQALRAVEARR